MPTEGRQSDMDTHIHYMRCMSHINTTTKNLRKHQNSPLFCSSPRPIVSDPSLPSIIITPSPPNPLNHYAQPFQVAGKRGLTRRYRLATSGLITREAATSEHCVESRRHTGKESALYLATPTPTHPTLNENNL